MMGRRTASKKKNFASDICRVVARQEELAGTYKLQAAPE